MSTVVLTLGKVELNLNKLISKTLFIAFVKFEMKQWFSAYQDQVCAWFSLARLPTEAARKLSLYHFLKKRLYLSFSGFSNLFNASAAYFPFVNKRCHF